MSVVYLGSLSVGGTVPGASAAITAGIAGINSVLSDLLSRLAALQLFVPTSLGFAAQLTLAQQMVTSINLAIVAVPPLPIPDLAAQIAIIAALIAELIAQIASITANLDVMLDLQAPLAAAGVHAYAFDGQTNQFGSQMGAELVGGVPGGSGTDHANAIALITTIGATWDAMSLVFKVAP